MSTEQHESWRERRDRVRRERARARRVKQIVLGAITALLSSGALGAAYMFASSAAAPVASAEVSGFVPSPSGHSYQQGAAGENASLSLALNGVSTYIPIPATTASPAHDEPVELIDATCELNARNFTGATVYDIKLTLRLIVDPRIRTITLDGLPQPGESSHQFWQLETDAIPVSTPRPFDDGFDVTLTTLVSRIGKGDIAVESYEVTLDLIVSSNGIGCGVITGAASSPFPVAISRP